MSKKFFNFYKTLLFYTYVPLSFIILYLFIVDKNFFISNVPIIILSCASYCIIFYKKISFDFNFLKVFLFILYCFIFISIYYISGDKIDSSGRFLSTYHYNLVILYFISYFAGRNSYFRINSVTLIVFFIMVSTVFSILDTTTLSLDLNVINDDKVSFYIALSDLFSIFLIYIISFSKRLIHKFLIFALGLICLFVLNSRAALYIYVIIFVIYFFIYFDFNNKLRFSFLGLIGIILSSAFINFDWLLINNSRMLAIFTGIGGDASNIIRNDLLTSGISRTLRSPFLGDYGGVIEEFNSLGSYIHNIFSFWQSFGFIAFCFSLYFFILQPIFLIINSFRNKSIIRTDIYFILSLYLIFMFIFARSYGWIYGWFILGYIHNYNQYFRTKNAEL